MVILGPKASWHATGILRAIKFLSLQGRTAIDKLLVGSSFLLILTPSNAQGLFGTVFIEGRQSQARIILMIF